MGNRGCRRRLPRAKGEGPLKVIAAAASRIAAGRTTFAGLAACVCTGGSYIALVAAASSSRRFLSRMTMTASAYPTWRVMAVCPQPLTPPGTKNTHPLEG
jgi:hypothetical protein